VHCLVKLENGTKLDLSDAVIARFGIHVGDVLTDAQVHTAEVAERERTAKEIALNFLSYRPRSSREITDRLIKKGYDRELAVDIVRQFQSLALVNDREFALMYARDRIHRRSLGEHRLRHELTAKGVQPSIIDEVLHKLLSTEKQEEMALELGIKRLRLAAKSFAKLDPVQQRKRLQDFLLGRGFSPGIALRAVRQLLLRS